MTISEYAEAFYRHQLSLAPIRIEVELTEACNLRCSFCYNSCAPVFAATCDVLNTFEALATQGVLEVVLTGGEPLLHPDFELLALRAGALFPRAFVQTNGTFLTPTLVKSLQAAGFLGISVSLHGDKDVHEQLTHVSGSYHAALEGIMMTLRYPLATWVNMVLTTLNWTQVGQHLTCLDEIGIRNFTFTRFTSTGRGRDALLALNSTQVEQVARVLDDFLCTHPYATILMANAIPHCALSDDLTHFAEPCSYGIDRFYVNVKSELMLCGMSRIVLGEVLRTPIQQIKLESGIYRRLCLCDALPSSCKACDDVLRCRGGCRAAALASTGHIDGADPLARRT